MRPNSGITTTTAPSKTVYNTMNEHMRIEGEKSSLNKSYQKRSASIGNKTSISNQFGQTFEEVHSAKGPKRRIQNHITASSKYNSNLNLDLTDIDEKSRFVVLDRRGDLKKFHQKDENSMREVAAVRQMKEEI